MMYGGKIFTYSRWMGHSLLGGWSWLIWIGAALVVAAVICFVVSKGKTKDSDALAALNMKFVKGEINEEEYLSKKSVLKGK